MELRKKVEEILYKSVADVFMKDESYIVAHTDLNFRLDLNASSTQYYPLISDLEEQLDIDIDAHDFQYNAQTIAQAVDYVLSVCASK